MRPLSIHPVQLAGAVQWPRPASAVVVAASVLVSGGGRGRHYIDDARVNVVRD